MCPAWSPKDTFLRLRGQDKQASPVSVPLCEQCHGQMRLSNSIPANNFCLRAICRSSLFQSRADGGAWHGPPNLILKFEFARQASSPSLCASVRAVAWADEAEQQLSRLALSGCQISADVRIFRAGLPEPPCTNPRRYV